jgi:hypothetical protein
VKRSLSGHYGRRLAALLLASAFSIALEGCGDVPNAPPPPETVSEPPLLVVRSNGTTSFEQVTVTPAGTVPDPLPGSRSLKVSKEIDGTKGGWVRCGRFFLAISAGAFDTTGTVTMAMRDSTVMVVALEISPAELNDFKAPVYLAANTTNTDVPSDSLALYWMDPTTGKWTDVTTEKIVTTATTCVSQVDPIGGDGCPDSSWASVGVTSTLQHFSVYSTGKAGW